MVFQSGMSYRFDAVGKVLTWPFSDIFFPNSQKITSPTASKPTTTATALPQMSQQDALNKKMAASLLTKDLQMSNNMLGTKSLLGM
jgi:hypothetical protein